MNETGAGALGALNEDLALNVFAQPTIKDGKINRLLITHAEIVDKELV
jgi:hypothetical protein